MPTPNITGRSFHRTMNMISALPCSLKALLIQPLLTKYKIRGQGVRARYDTELPPLIFFVGHPGCPVMTSSCCSFDPSFGCGFCQNMEVWIGHKPRGRTLQQGVLSTFWNPHPSKNHFLQLLSPLKNPLQDTFQEPFWEPSAEPFWEPPSKNPSLKRVLSCNPLSVHPTFWCEIMHCFRWCLERSNFTALKKRVWITQTSIIDMPLVPLSGGTLW